MVEDRLRRHFDYYLGKTEIVIYSVLALLLAVTAFVTIATACQILWIGLSHWTVAAQTLRVLNQLLIVRVRGCEVYSGTSPGLRNLDCDRARFQNIGCATISTWGARIYREVQN